MQIIKVVVLSLALTLLSVVAVAKNNNKIANEAFSGSSISFSSKIDVNNATLTISGPDGFSAHASSKSGLPSINLLDYGLISDGRYKYQITSSTEQSIKTNNKNAMNNGRRQQKSQLTTSSISQSGHFFIESGQVKQFATATNSNN